MKPSAYNVKTLNMFGGQWGTGSVYNKETGGLFGLIWKQKVAKGEPAFTTALNYVADENDEANSAKGIGTELSEGNTTAQIGYGTKKWGAALGYRYGQCGAKFGTAYQGAQTCANDVDSQNFALNAYWKPEQAGLVPSISAGYGWSSLNNGSSADTDLNTWMVGFQWDKLAGTDHKFAVAFGAPTQVTSVADPGLAWEAGLKYKVSSKISVTPAIFYIPRSAQSTANSSQFGGVVQTVFKF